MIYDARSDQAGEWKVNMHHSRVLDAVPRALILALPLSQMTSFSMSNAAEYHGTTVHMKPHGDTKTGFAVWWPWLWHYHYASMYASCFIHRCIQQLRTVVDLPFA